MKTYLNKLSNNENLTKDEMVDASRLLFAEDITDSEIAAFLMTLKTKGETPDEIAGLVEVLRAHALRFNKTFPGVMDNCGTGGDGSQSFNISTTSAFVIAGAGVTVAKHGNRSVSSKTGSADVLETLGVSLDFTVGEVEQLLEDNGIAFLFAPHVHPNLKRIMKVRKELKVPTIFNLIGPLTNPVDLDAQLLGIYKRDRIEMMASALERVGRKRAVVINGAGYMDEASLAGENHAALLEDGEITPFTIHPEDVGLTSYPLEDIRGGDSKENAEILKAVLAGEKGPHLDTVLFNAGLGLYAQGKAATLREGVDLARESVESGAALQKLNYLVEYSQKKRKEVV
ncbi:anthranilate phosphoribosyltransferase [Salirhabdus salicampi]|uniref:anthranilate phosphoribosyltransferase n=1 Tax=Salirhabdus salicampi TaxID=476102 RepID=UPI0020C37145|nr:anthranilate phosphoribosyltransferase [Salirhabdus salicampi]MCP8617980.1 anthranilate phosphoribosyltransferase [Salirhabdus salicampi]